ncbi:unnamed protein product [Phaeothamnion confervicola]
MGKACRVRNVASTAALAALLLLFWPHSSCYCPIETQDEVRNDKDTAADADHDQRSLSLATVVVRRAGVLGKVPPRLPGIDAPIDNANEVARLHERLELQETRRQQLEQELSQRAAAMQQREAVSQQKIHQLEQQVQQLLLRQQEADAAAIIDAEAAKGLPEAGAGGAGGKLTAGTKAPPQSILSPTAKHPIVLRAATPVAAAITASAGAAAAAAETVAANDVLKKSAAAVQANLAADGGIAGAIAGNIAAPKPRIAMLVLADATTMKKRMEHIASLRCYAVRHGYLFLLDYMEVTPECAQAAPPFFLKQCRVASILAANGIDGSDSAASASAASRRFDWLVVLDSDVFVVNAAPQLEAYLPTDDPRIHAVFYERFHNGEIMAGNYIVRASASGLGLVRRWVAMQRPPGGTGRGVPNYDNGALHIVALNETTAERGDGGAGYAKCLQMGQTVRRGSRITYQDMVGCARCYLGGRRNFPRAGIRILRRGHGFARDFFVSSPGQMTKEEGPVDNMGVIVKAGDGGIDLFYHGWKDSLRTFYAADVDPTGCTKDREWNPKIRTDRQATMERTKRRVALRALYATTDRRRSVAVDDVSGCWPECPPELTAAQEAQMRKAICPSEVNWKKLSALPKRR